MLTPEPRNRKVYLVSAGSYEMNHVVAVCSDRGEAKAMAALLDDGGIEEWKVDEKELADPGKDYFDITMFKSGESEVKERSRLDWGGDRRTPYCTFRTGKDYSWERESFWRLEWEGYANSREDALALLDRVRQDILAGKRPKEVDSWGVN